MTSPCPTSAARPASDIVAATEGTGNEFFYQGQLIANSVFAEGDLFVAGVRFADLKDSNLYVADFSARYPLMDDLKINPRLLLQYRTGKTSDLEEYTIQPSVLFNYYITRDWSLELEAGATWSRQTENGSGGGRYRPVLHDRLSLRFLCRRHADLEARAAPYGSGAPK